MAFYSTTAIFNSVDKVSDIVGRIGDNIAGMGDRVQRDMMQAVNQTKGLEHAFGTLAVGGVGLATAAIAQGVQQFFDLNGAMAGVSARTGMTGADLDTFKKQVTDAFANQGIITNISDMARVVETIKTQTMGLAATDMTKFTGEIVALAKAYGLDPANLADQVGKVQGKFIQLRDASPEVTLDALLKAAQDSGEPLNEIADAAAKYGSRLAGAGLTGFGAISMISGSLQLGITNFAEMTKSVEKFHENLTNPKWPVKQALKDMGLQSVVADLKSGKSTFDEVLDKVYNGLAAIEDPAKRAKDATILFGQSAQKLGGADVLSGLSGFTREMDTAGGTAERATQSMNSSFGNFLSTTWNKFTSAVSTGVDQVYNALKNADWAGAINTIKGLIEPIWDSIFGEGGFFRKTVPDAINSVINFVGGIVGEIGKTFGSIASAITGALAPIIGFIDGIIKKIGELLTFSESSAPSVQGAIGMAQGKTEHPKTGIPGLPLKGPVESYTPGHAWGGSLDEGLNIVGELGPEAIWKQGGRAQVFTNRETKQILGSGAGGGGHSTVVHLSIGNLVGSGGMQELARVLYPLTQKEDLRRSTG